MESLWGGRVLLSAKHKRAHCTAGLFAQWRPSRRLLQDDDTAETCPSLVHGAFAYAVHHQLADVPILEHQLELGENLLEGVATQAHAAPGSSRCLPWRN